MGPLCGNRRRWDWRAVEAHFRATRDPAMQVTLPRLKFMEKDLEDDRGDRRRDAA